MLLDVVAIEHVEQRPAVLPELELLDRIREIGLKMGNSNCVSNLVSNVNDRKVRQSRRSEPSPCRCGWDSAQVDTRESGISSQESRVGETDWETASRANNSNLECFEEVHHFDYETRITSFACNTYKHRISFAILHPTRIVRIDRKTEV